MQRTDNTNEYIDPSEEGRFVILELDRYEYACGTVPEHLNPPKDNRILAMKYRYPTRSWVLKVSSKEFNPVPRDGKIPVFSQNQFVAGEALSHKEKS